MKNKIILLVIALALVILPFASEKVAYFGVIAFFGAILAVSTNIFMGYCGQIMFGGAAFALIGGYTVGLMEKFWDVPFGLSVLCAIVVGAIIATIVSFPLLRMRGHVLAIGTFALFIVAYATVSSGFTKITGGEDGISLAKLDMGGFLSNDVGFYLIMLVVLALCLWISYAVRNSRVGWAMLTISQDETAAASMGMNVRYYLFIGLLLNGVMATLAGAIYVKWMEWVSPEFFSITTNIMIILSLFIGGIGTLIGPIIGGLVTFLLPQFLLAWPDWHVLIFAGLLTVTLLFAPKGILGLFSVFRRTEK